MMFDDDQDIDEDWFDDMNNRVEKLRRVVAAIALVVMVGIVFGVTGCVLIF